MYPDGEFKSDYETDDAIYFFTSGFYALNNWSAHAITIWDKKFTTLEHAYHYKKYVDNHPAIAAKILAAPSPWAAMQIDRRNRAKRRPDWPGIKVSVMEELARAKLEQNIDVRDCLLKTGSKRIVENSPWDDFWGCGADGKGQNIMGKLLTKLREEYKSKPSNRK
ncbi:MAG: NADAR family protein [Candidatus Saccharimonadales bacterium]